MVHLIQLINEIAMLSKLNHSSDNVDNSNLPIAIITAEIMHITNNAHVLALYMTS